MSLEKKELVIGDQEQMKMNKKGVGFMESIIDVIGKLENLKHLKGASREEIKNAERILNLSFALDYKKYLGTYGTIIAIGIELTGLNVSPRINVVDVTLNERKINPNIPSNMYVIENTAIEGILILQNEKSEIFELNNVGIIKKIYNSLSEYITSLSSLI